MADVKTTEKILRLLDIISYKERQGILRYVIKNRYFRVADLEKITNDPGIKHKLYGHSPPSVEDVAKFLLYLYDTGDPVLDEIFDNLLKSLNEAIQIIEELRESKKGVAKNAS